MRAEPPHNADARSGHAHIYDVEVLSILLVQHVDTAQFLRHLRPIAHGLPLDAPLYEAKGADDVGLFPHRFLVSSAERTLTDFLSRRLLGAATKN